MQREQDNNSNSLLLRTEPSCRWEIIIFGCIETPGHTQGHICLYESSQRLLLSGDHILGISAQILPAGLKNGYQVAAEMTWDMVYDTLEEVAAPQKFFATGEAHSHLRFLVGEGLAHSMVQNGIIMYRRS